jgi:putative ABC transport system substrate-binding protein
VTIEYRWAQGQYDRLPPLAAELTSRPVAVLVATGGQPAALAAKAATATIPIVATFSADPIASGFVGNLSRAKRLGLMHELVPRATTMGVLLNPNFPTGTNSEI